MTKNGKKKQSEELSYSETIMPYLNQTIYHWV